RSSIGGNRGGLFYWSTPGFGGRPAFDPAAAASALRPPLALCPAALCPAPAFARRLPCVASVDGRFEGRATAQQQLLWCCLHLRFSFLNLLR
ncbi:MAG: hypothetical protein BJ554DRAFT_6815, partial [Olpidium bornovanus]